MENPYKKALQDSIASALDLPEVAFSGIVSASSFNPIAEQSLIGIDRDMRKLRASSDVIFPSVAEDQSLPLESGMELAKLFHDLRKSPPSIASVITVAADKFGIEKNHPLLRAAFMISIAADIATESPYHNSNHTREVTIAMTRLIYAYQQQKKTPLSQEDICLCLVAAVGHDLMHDGTGNRGIPYRLEDNAFHAILPFLKTCGITAEQAHKIHMIIRVTDISTGEDGVSPQSALKNYLITGNALPAPGIEDIFKDKKLLLLAGFMGDADLTPSAGTSYAFSRLMNNFLHRETRRVVPDTPQTTLGFIDHVLQGQFSTAIGRQLGQASLAEIRRQAEKNAGNPPPLN
jgi:hypothetical protein